MNKTSNKLINIILVIAFIVILVLSITIPIIHGTFDENWIVGNTVENIVKRYGLPEEMSKENIDNFKDGYIYYKLGKGIVGDVPVYIIYFENGIAYKCKKAGALPGG